MLFGHRKEAGKRILKHYDGLARRQGYGFVHEADAVRPNFLKRKRKAFGY